MEDYLAQLPPEVLEEILEDPVVAKFLETRAGFWGKFQPRPNRPENFDEQQAFCDSDAAVSFLIGGNAAGTTEAAAFKTAQLVLHRQKPPRKDTPFWIIANTYEQSIATCWNEKLLGNGHIPDCEIEWDRVRWLDTRSAWPLMVPLKPWPGEDPNKNWCLVFKSYEQGRRAMQAQSIGGFWFSEQFPWQIFLEVLRGCRNYMFPGAQFAEFTPIEPELCMQIEKIMERPPPGWKFFRANTESNKANLADGWFDQFFGVVPEEMKATRMTGALASFEGVIYQSFNPSVHLVGDETINPALPGTYHYRGVDWGASAEHPFVTLWGYRDGRGDWFIYDEYWNPRQDMITADHIDAILERWPWPTGNPHFGSAFADPSRPGEINEFNYGGIPTSPAMNDVYEGIKTVRTMLKINPATRRPRLYIHRKRCPHLADEMRKYRWRHAKRPTEGSILNPAVAAPVPLKRDDDTCDALRYMLHTAERHRGAGVTSMSHSDYAEKTGAVQMDRRGGGSAADSVRFDRRG